MLPNSADYFSEAPKHVTTIAHASRGDGSASIYDFLGESAHYASTFGLQWKKYRDVQIDRLNGTRNSYNHLQTFVQGDLSVFSNATCLEIGSGAGRFTDYLVDLCPAVITIEPTQALTVNAALGAPNLVAAHADLFRVPIRREKIDVVFCRGVTQHTRDPKEAIQRLFDYVRPGGTVMFDVYPLRWYTPFVTKYWLRPWLRHVNARHLTNLVERAVPKLLRIKNRLLTPILPANVWGRNIGNQLIPIADFTGVKHMDTQQQLLWSILDTVDMYTPRYDKPMTFRAILGTLRQIGAREIKANKSSFCFKAVAP
jgi:2-polyprenyl-3-methyl-5-hydroxy-6-metoxy-1,4-benzoquinol methylase